MTRIPFKSFFVLATLLVVATAGAWGSTFKVIYNFTGGQDGGLPVDAGNLGIAGNVALDPSGTLYGTTELGGDCGQGTLFKLSPNGGGWTETVLHSFCGHDGAYPTAAPEDFNSSLYGTTTYGGTFGEGTFYIYQGSLLAVSLQCGSGPNGPRGGGCFPYTTPVTCCVDLELIESFETFYGGGTNGRGLLFADPSTLYSFCPFSGCADGSGAGSALAFDGNGNMYGTTRLGGASGLGVVYECVAQPDGSCIYTVLHSFAGGANDGALPFLATPTVVQSCLQNFCNQTIWGTTPLGGAGSGNGGPGFGTVFAIPTFFPFNVVHSFNRFDGAYPYAGLTNLNGTFYGTTSGGGPFQRECCPVRFRAGRGTIYSLTPGGTLTTLHVFTGPDGANPYSGLVADSSGNLYGVTFEGGAFGFGVVYEITP